MTRLASWYRRAEAFYARNRLVFQVAWGAFVSAAAVLTVIVAFVVAAQQSREHEHHREEATTVRLQCERTLEFAPAIGRDEVARHVFTVKQGEDYFALIPVRCPSR